MRLDLIGATGGSAPVLVSAVPYPIVQILGLNKNPLDPADVITIQGHFKHAEVTIPVIRHPQPCPDYGPCHSWAVQDVTE